MALFTLKNPAAVALVAATAKSLLYNKSGSQLGVKYNRWGVGFDGTTPTAVDVVVELVRVTSDATGGTSRTPTSLGSIAEADTSYCTSVEAPTGGATAGDILFTYLVPPTSGYVELAALGDEITCAKNERLILRCTAPAAVNAIGGLGWRE